MAIGSPRWGGIRPDPYNPDSPDADNDGIVQEGTLFERPAGTRIVSTLTGLELDLGTPGNSLQDVSNTQIVDREGRPVDYRQSWSSGTLSAGERNGTIGNSNGTVGSSLGNLDGPPPAPKPDPVRLRSTDVDKNGKPLRVFVSDDRRFHGVMPQDWAGFDNPAWRQADAHWGGSLRDGEMPISANDPRLPDTLFYVTRNPSAQRDLGVVRTDGERVDLFVSREDADEALSAERLDYPGAGIVEVPTENIQTGAAVTLSDGTGGEFSSVYHGSPDLTPDGRPSVRNAQETRGTVWFARDRDLAEEYTYPREFGESVTEFFDEDTGEYVEVEPGPVLNFGLDINNPMYYDAEGRSVDAVEQARLVREAKENGHDALVLNNVDDSVDGSGTLGQVIAVFDDSKIVPVRRTQVSVFGDVRLSADSAPEPVRREADIPTPDSLDPIKERFDAEGFELYLVGGAVRDTLMGRDIKDYDLASDATPDQIEAMLADVDGARLDLTGKDFAVVRVNMPDGEEYEIATFRRDVGEGRRPDEVEFTTIDEDVRRRDLTMNALFYDLSTNEIVDYVGGIDDIENGVVRAVGDPGERFREDPLRILRAFRFSGRTGWGMDSATVDAIRSNSALRGVSGERVHDEFVRGIDSAVSPSGYIQQIDLVDNGTGAVWGQVFPGLNVSPERLPADGSYGNRSVLVASLLADNDIDSVKAVLKDRKFTNDEIADVELIMQARNINDGNVATLKNKFGKNDRVSADDMRAFHGVQPETEDEIEPFLQFADAPPALTANDLQEQGIKPGPQFGAMLREAEEQRYREIRDGFSVGGDAPEPAAAAEALDVDRGKKSYRNADKLIADTAAERPELASDPEQVRSVFGVKEGAEEPGFVKRDPANIAKNREAQQADLEAYQEQLEAMLNDPTTKQSDIDNQTEWIEYQEAYIAELDDQIASGGVWEEVQIFTYGEDAPESVQNALTSDRMSEAVNSVLGEYAPEYRTALIAISPTDSNGGEVPLDTAYYFEGEDTIYMHPDFFADVFREEGVSFEDYAKWANSQGSWSTDVDYNPENLQFEEREDLERIADGIGIGYDESMDDNELIDLIKDNGIATAQEEMLSSFWKTGKHDTHDDLSAYRREILLHELAHGIHFRRDADWDSPEFREVRNQVLKALKETELFDRITANGKNFADADNYFQYAMNWLGFGTSNPQVQKDFLESVGTLDDKEVLRIEQGRELFAEAITHSMLGREYPGAVAFLKGFLNEEEV